MIFLYSIHDRFQLILDMKNRQWLSALLLGSVLVMQIACKEKKKEEEKKKFISILSLLKEQVAHIDTSLYVIRKIVITDSLHSDTSFIRRDDFSVEAKDFLSIPDLSDKKVAKRFREESPFFDENLNRVIITYTPVDPVKEEINKMELLVTPGTLEGDKVTSIIITSIINNRNGFRKKEMLWQMDRSFQVVVTSQLPGEPEKTITTKVTWNEETDQ